MLAGWGHVPERPQGRVCIQAEVTLGFWHVQLGTVL